MTSEPPEPLPVVRHPGRRRPVVVYLDANVLAAGLARTLVLLCGQLADYRTVWSRYAEREAARHQPPGATPITLVRERHELTIVPDRPAPIPLTDTDAKDQPILAAASAAGVGFVVSENVKDFGPTDLAALGMSVVHPDLFLATRVRADEYLFVLAAIAENRHRDPRTPAAIHTVEVAARLPLLYTAHHDTLNTDDLTSTDMGASATVPVRRPARLQFRGVRCLNCAETPQTPEELTGGLCEPCRTETTD